MKTILKTIGIVLVNLITLFLLYLFLDNIGGLIEGSFLKEFDFKDWMYEFKRNHTLNYLIATSMLSGGLYLTYKITISFITNVNRFIVGIISGCIIVISITLLYWKYVQEYCFGLEWSMIEDAFSVSFGSTILTKLFWIIFSSIVFLLGIFVNRAEFLIADSDKRVIWHQAFGGEDSMCEMLYLGIPYCIFIAGSYFVVGFIGVSIKLLILIFSIGIILYIFTHGWKRYSYLQRYYIKVKEKVNVEKGQVIVQEAKYVQKPFITSFFYKNKIFEKMDDNEIQILPYEMHQISDCFIKLDVLDKWMFIRPISQQKKIFDSISDLRGTFNILFEPDNLPNTIPKYDGAFTEIESLTNEIIRLNRYLNYRKIITYELNKIDMTRLNGFSCISEEVSNFRKVTERLTDEFLCFDYSIKWMEITNYFFALIGISKRNLRLSEVLLTKKSREKLVYADFYKWRKFIDDISSTDEDLQTIITVAETDKTAFSEFGKIWTIVTSRHYSFKSYTVQEMLGATNKLRDYTRGHGVFTFEISQEINIGLIKILAFLLSRLMDYLYTTDNMDNLEKLGWVIYIGDIPYYLYSFDERFNELKYESFQKGNSIALPMDIQEGL
nr:hypothetical protein [uncultured Agathobacter sp.]